MKKLEDNEFGDSETGQRHLYTFTAKIIGSSCCQQTQGKL
jgi:hypothetical protein